MPSSTLLPLPPLNSDTPLVSVIMFCRNRVSLIRRSIESVLQQTYPHWELIVQDGASTDGTLETIRSYPDDRIKIVSERDSGPFDAMWRAYRRCQGEITGSCLSDETLLPTALEEGVQYFRCHPETAAIIRDVMLKCFPEPGVVIQGVESIDADGALVRHYPCPEFNFVNYLSIKAAVVLQTILFRREALLDLGLLTRAWRTDCADFELFTLLARRYRIDTYPGLAGSYCQHSGDQLSTTPSIGFFCAVGQLRFIDEYFRNDPTLTRLRGYVLGTAYRTIKDLYQAKKAAEWEAKLDAFMATLPPWEEAYSLEMGVQAVGTGNLFLASNILSSCLPTTPQGFMEYLAVSEAVDSLLDPTESSEYWSNLANQNIPGAAERFLSTQLRTPGNDPFKILANQKKWALHLDGALEPEPLNFHPFTQARKRLAFHAADWTTPEMQCQIIPLLPHLDSDQFETIVYVPPQRGPFHPPAQVRSIPLTNTSAAAFRQQTRGDEIEILIELSGLQPGHQFAALAGRCAPRQVAYLGHMATTGHRQIDYQLVDDIICPSSLARWHTERILALPSCYTSFSIPCPTSAPPHPPPQRLDDRFTFGCLADTSLLNKSVLDCWARLLLLNPHSRLLIASPNVQLSDRRTQLRNFFLQYKVPRESVLVVSRPPGDISPYLTAQMDLYLDTFPHSDPLHLACCLSRGVPGVTLLGSTMAGRLGASLLHAAGLDQWVTLKVEEYAAAATLLVQHRQDLQIRKDSLPQQIFARGLTDPARFAADFQQLLAHLPAQ